jgi:hypothetical protein
MRRDGGPELVIRGKDAVAAMPVLPGRRHEVSEPVEELKWGELEGRLVPGAAVAVFARLLWPKYPARMAARLAKTFQ